MTLLRIMIQRTVLLIGLAAVATVWPSGSSTAGANEPGWLSVPGGLPLFDLAEITPGDSGSATLVVTNPQFFPVTFSLAVTGLATDDNGCNEPEQVIGDTTCGRGGGELQSDLRLALTAGATPDRLVAVGTVDQWAVQSSVDVVALGGHESRTYRIEYVLPTTSSNMTQSDLVSFQFEMRLDQVLDSVASDPPPAVVVATPSLPGTGSDAGALVLIGLATILVGCGLFTMGTRGRRSS